MEIELGDLTIGYQEKIDLSKLTGNNNNHVNTFQKMATPDGSSYVIIYQWVDSMSRTFGDREEAFYIDGINEENKEKAKNIFIEVSEELDKAFKNDPNQVLDMSELVNGVIEKYKAMNM